MGAEEKEGLLLNRRAALHRPTETFIDGPPCPAADGARFANIVPGNGCSCGDVVADDPRDVGVMRRPRAERVWINGWDVCDITMPPAGVKPSDFGRDRSLHALAKYADLKAITPVAIGRT